MLGMGKVPEEGWILISAKDFKTGDRHRSSTYSSTPVAPNEATVIKFHMSAEIRLRFEIVKCVGQGLHIILNVSESKGLGSFQVEPWGPQGISFRSIVPCDELQRRRTSGAARFKRMSCHRAEWLFKTFITSE